MLGRWTMECNEVLVLARESDVILTSRVVVLEDYRAFFKHA